MQGSATGDDRLPVRLEGLRLRDIERAAVERTLALTGNNRSEAARIPTIMSFGKHKGMPIKDVPADYKRWLLGQSDIDPYLAIALRR